jgi:hypothetical protein
VALFISTSKELYFPLITLTKWLTLFFELISVGINKAVFLPKSSFIIFSAFFPFFLSSSAIITLAPNQAKERAASKPMPPPAPVINAVNPVNCPFLSSLYL